MRLEFCITVKLKLCKLASNHKFHYLTSKHKLFSFTVAAKFSMHANIKCLYMELYLIGLLSLGLMYVKKINNFSRVLKRCRDENLFFFSASQCGSLFCITFCEGTTKLLLWPLLLVLLQWYSCSTLTTVQVSACHVDVWSRVPACVASNYLYIKLCDCNVLKMCHYFKSNHLYKDKRKSLHPQIYCMISCWLLLFDNFKWNVLLLHNVVILFYICFCYDV